MLTFKRSAWTMTVALCAASLVPAATLINGAGATFPNPMYSKWFSEYRKLHPDVQINYQPLGSGAGITQVTEGTVDFGATDGPMSDMQLADFKQKRGTDILHFPTVMGAVVVTYNVSGVTGALNLTPDAIAGIFLGKITKWNDPAITKTNSNVKLPAADIVVVHRSDGSGTTYCFTDYLAKVSPAWVMKVGKAAASVNWPVGLGGRGNDGVAGQVKQTPNSLGYVELIYAEQNKMAYANVQNSSGAFVKPSLQSVTAAAAGAAKTMPDDFRVSITNEAGKDAYPISTFTWLLIPVQIKDTAKKTALVDFLKWMLKEGQTMTQALTYAPLPKEVVEKEAKAITKIK